jgi:hypothetical protein
MTFFTTVVSLLRRNVNEYTHDAVSNMTTAIPNTLTVLETPKPHLQEETPPLAKVIAVQGTCGYNAFRRFLFKAAYPKATRELVDNPRILIERDMNPAGRIYVEADGKETLFETEEGIHIVRVRYVVGIIYNSISGNTELRWRDNKPRGKVWGHITRRSLGLLLSCNAQVKTTSTSTNS